MNNHRLFELMEELNKATDYEQIQQVINSFCKALGFDHFIYGALVPTSHVSPSYIILSGYPPEWRERYFDQDYMMIDPTVSHCFNNTTPVYWENIINTECKENKAANILFSEAHDHGLKNGISLPVHCIHGETAMFSLSTEVAPGQSRSLVKNSLAIGQLFVNYVHEAIVRVPGNSLLAKANSELSAREKECLLWTTEGKTSREISNILNISERTVVFHLNNVIKKLNVFNKQHAVARAISLGYIKPAL